MLAPLQKLMIEHALYPLMEKRRGNHIREYYRALRQTEAAAPEALHALQRERLEALLLDCVQHVPAYQGCLTEEEIHADPFAALRRLPPVRKTDIRANPDAYLNTSIPASARIANVTGGSTGQPLRFFMDRAQVEQYEAARWRGLSWYGITFGSRSVMIWGNPIELGQNAQAKHAARERLLKNRVILSAYELNGQTLRERIDFLNRYQPEYLYGYASALYAFARLLQPHRQLLRLKKLKAVVSTSETLHPEQAELLREVFGCPVANEYGARDAGILAYTCPACGKLHITAENALIEVLDPVTLQPVPDGTDGVLAVTDLCNHIMPRPRYLLGDTGTRSAAPCSGCAVTLPTLDQVGGREDALFLLPDGTLIHGNFIGQLARRYASVLQFQLVQTDPAHAVLYLVQQPEHDDEREALLAEARAVLTGIDLRCEPVDEIAPTASGKLRYAVRSFPLPQK